jgi:hypothetical protein
VRGSKVADGEAGILGCNGVDKVGLDCKSFDRTEWLIEGRVKHCTGALTIVLVI